MSMARSAAVSEAANVAAAPSEQRMVRLTTAGAYSGAEPSAGIARATSQTPAMVATMAPQWSGSGRAPRATEMGTAIAG